ncbi:desmethyl-deoxy-podophyllotoxin synthase [Populus trichocarpa]|uniref:desmethyl-deoxy-podophyllotoxin synthase n=1 Tax=Populus trichocarpa TaxID=3694 RepID=UPI00227845F1|nr:desmethyl-deoxy-podophyllotoxin synthase [Populus trichocarpa]
MISLTKERSLLAGGFNVVDELYPALEFLQGVIGMKAEKVLAQINQILDNIINEHKEMGNSETIDEDPVHMLVRLQEDGTFKCPIEYSTSKLASRQVLEFIEWAMKEIMKNPRVVKKAQAEIREALRGKKTITEAEIREALRGKKTITEAEIREALRGKKTITEAEIREALLFILNFDPSHFSTFLAGTWQ